MDCSVAHHRHSQNRANQVAIKYLRQAKYKHAVLRWTPERQHLSDIELDLESQYVGEKRKMGWTDDGFGWPQPELMVPIYTSSVWHNTTNSSSPPGHFHHNEHAIQRSVIKKKEDDSWYSKNHIKYLL